MSPQIKQLDPITITKIAAGEVIDRPASIVKELIENSIDAKATKITIKIENGGKKTIAITDNGSGIYPDDLVIAPKPHTTSKITVIEDLTDIGSFGFRGEALASICHAAKLTITSKTESELGYSITAFQDEISDLAPATHPRGTTILVQDLFFDMPVRRKFFKTDATELSHILDIVTQFCLVFPAIDFELTSNEKTLINTTGISDQNHLLVQFFGKSIKDQLVPVETTIGSFHISGWISDPTLTYGNRNKQFFAVNNRVINNSVLYRATQISFKDRIPARRFPLVLLHLSTEQNQIDVNIHPQKLDIKFLDPSFIFDALPKAISVSLQAHHAKSIPLTTQPVPDPHQPPTPVFVPEPVSDATPPPEPEYENFSYTPPPPPQPAAIESAMDLFKPTELTQPETSYTHFQIFETYIVVKAPSGIIILDQHAVHERILYERIKTDFGQETNRQPLLVTEVIDLPPDEFAVFESNSDYFSHLNFVIEPFGANQIKVIEIPVAFQSSNLSILIPEIISQIKDIPESARDLTLDQKERLQRKACIAAIKAGKKMHPSEVSQLIKDLIDSPSNYTCPHGRPLYIQLNQSKLETLFLRT